MTTTSLAQEPTRTGVSRVVVLSGNPRPGSRTQALGAAVANRIAAETGAEVRVVDLGALTDQLFTFPAPAALEEALATAASAGVLVVATPTYKGTYTGLLKAFLDRYGPGGLDGVTAVPVQVAADRAHLAAADVHLRPLLLELGARVPTRALTVIESQLPDSAREVARWAQTELRAITLLAAARAVTA